MGCLGFFFSVKQQELVVKDKRIASIQTWSNQKGLREDCLGQKLKPGLAWILTGETIRRIRWERIVWVKISSLVRLGFWQVKQSEEYDERGLFGSKSQAWYGLGLDRGNNQKKRATYKWVIGLEIQQKTNDKKATVKWIGSFFLLYFFFKTKSCEFNFMKIKIYKLSKINPILDALWLFV